MGKLVIYILLILSACKAYAQEAVGPLYFRPLQGSKAVGSAYARSAAKGTVATLPFFEDFTGDSFFPDTSLWVDRKVYINNNMGNNPITKGVATFDAIDENGLPYEIKSKARVLYADSLTSQQIDLSVYSPADSIYLSFFYQPQGNGFDPQPEDSLILYFRRSNTTTPWTRVWRVAGSTLQPFKQVMIPLTDAALFHAGFQFRFVNKASINNSDDHWHIDYIRMDANRNLYDTLVDDVSYIETPSFLLNDYTYMPYHQFLANTNGERAAQMTTSIRNNGLASANVNYGYEAKESLGNTVLSTGANIVAINPNSENVVTFPVYTNTPTAPAKNEPITFDHKYYLQTNAGNNSLTNDTITMPQHFHNYMAYDDGTAEKSYYLKLFATLPGKIAIEQHLNVPDTLTGLAIYFGRQSPLAYQKFFSITVYKEIGFGGASEQLLYQEDFLTPDYLQQNSFWYYKLEQPIPLQAGKYYVGTTQPALSGSDSLYFGLDIHRSMDNHVYYNVVNEWEKSEIQGAVMIRPLFGNFTPSAISNEVGLKREELTVLPNPAKDRVRVNVKNMSGNEMFQITDVSGRIIKSGLIEGDGWIDIKDVSQGVYLIRIVSDDKISAPQKFIKL